MKGRRFTEEQIIAVLKEHEAGAPTKELCPARSDGTSAADRLRATRQADSLALANLKAFPALVCNEKSPEGFRRRADDSSDTSDRPNAYQPQAKREVRA
jgi:hypothetical protein